MKTKMLLIAVMASAGTVLTAPSATAQQILYGHVPETVARLHLRPIGRLPATNRLHLAIGLPFRNKEALTNLLQQLFDPRSANYRHYLTPQQFTDAFEPTEQDYQAVINFAKTNGLEVVGTYDNRILLDVSGKVSDIERVFHVTLRTYQHPTENREFYAPDIEPFVDLNVPMLDVSGLNNYARPHPMLHKNSITGNATPFSGSASGGGYMGNDFRNAYIPSVTLNGAGQMVGLVEFDSYYNNDITTYETKAGLSNVPLVNVSVDDFNVDGRPDGGDEEVSLDIEMVISMAPNLGSVVVFEAPNLSGVAEWNDMLNIMASASYNQIKQFSSSWGSGIAGPNASGDQILQYMAAHNGQSFFQASGDDDAYTTGEIIQWPCDSPWVTSVGGTALTMNGTGASYVSETVWNQPGGWGSGGGISPNYSIPSWQANISGLLVNGGSETMRNLPDVALVASNIWIVCENGQTGPENGTSFAAPLWAGFTALANQAAADAGLPSVGFINPSIYFIGSGPNYTSCFHDITTGNNTWSGSLYEFYAESGYDLCTGWGTPNGINLINALAFPRVIDLVAQSDLAFGNVQVNTTASRVVTIVNGGNTNLDISSISYPSGFTGNWSGTILAGNQVAIQVTFSPTALTSYGGTMTVNSDATVGVNTLPISGTGASPPPPSTNQIPVSAFETLHSFSGSDGNNPQAPLVLGSDGCFYGTTFGGGTSGVGTIFRINSGGSFLSLYSFTNQNNVVGNRPMSGLIQGTDGNFYGTTSDGAWGAGTVFNITSYGSLTLLATFYDTNGAFPFGGLVQGSDGNFYGTTESGGENPGAGTIFQMTPTGNLTMLYAFKNGTDGGVPYAGSLVASGDYFYGMTLQGGTNGFGTIYKITSNGAFTSLLSFSGTNGSYPLGGLIEGNDGNFYGMTFSGGTWGNGTVFRVTPGGTLTSLYSFTGGNDGSLPYGALVQATDGNFYGTTSAGGASGNGTIFQITSNGTFFTLHSFLGGNEGSKPVSGMVQGQDGNLYGTTSRGGTQNDGTVFLLVIPPAIQPIVQSGNTISITWSSVIGQTYQVQYTSDLTSTNWINLSNSITANSTIMSIPDPIGTNQQRFYRIVLFPEAW